MHSAPMRIWIILCCLLTSLAWTSTSEASDLFPVYDIISPNINFWTKVYTEYSTGQAIVHDSKDLDIIYAVIDLRPYEETSARKINRRRMKRACEKYEKILKRLGADPDTEKAEYRRVANLFGPYGNAETFRTASTRVRCQLGQSDRFRLGMIRSGAYIDQIKTIFRSYGLPEALAYLPHVESSFNIKAYSKFGAAGIWQFTRSTGQRFMKVGYVLDERRDPILATHAAASLLKDNFQKLGSWPLAITAYNHGATGMERAKASYGDYPAIFQSYRSRTFKFASRNFYSEFIAAYQIASNYRSYFGDIELDHPARFQTVSLDGYIGFEQLCRHFKLSPATARLLNPALRSPVFDGQKLVPSGYPFRLPADRQLASIPSDLLKARQRPSHFYTVQRGDTAGKIARLNGVKLDDLIMANNLDRRALIYPKQTLRIPLPGQAIAAARTQTGHKLAEPSAATVLASNDTETKALPVPAESAAEPPAATATQPRHDNPAPAGDNEVALESAAPTGNDDEPLNIAQAQSPDEPLVSEAVKDVAVSPVLASIIPAAPPEPLVSETSASDGKNEQPPSIEIVSADVRFETVVEHGKCTTGVLQVEIEETLGHYAEWADVRTQQIRRLNGLPFGQTLHLHQKIKIPLTKKTAGEFEESRYEYHKRLQEDFFAVYRVSELQPYRVKNGDNLWTLCLEKFAIPMWLLKNCNPEVDLAALQLHQKIMVPVIEKYTSDDPGLPAEPEPDESKAAIGSRKATPS